MNAYIVSDVTVKDAAAFEVYRTRAAPSIKQYGGRYLVRRGNVEALEGNWTPRNLVIIEFPSIERAKQWYRSPEYALALQVHDKALTRNMILVEGYVSLG
jgi:uncharacterized protein (DUF1330 family)